MDRKKIDRRSQKFWLTNQNSWTRVWRQNEGNYALYKRAFLRILGKLWMVLDRREGEMVPEKKITPKSCLVPELWPVLSFTVDPENRQDDFYITVTFSLVLYSPHMQESRSNGWKIYLGALFEKNPKLKILCLILHVKFTEQVKNILWQHIWIPDVISFHLICHTIYFHGKTKISFFSHRYWFWTAAKKSKTLFSFENI